MSCSASALIILFLQSMVIAGQFSDPKLLVSPDQPTVGDEITFFCSVSTYFNRRTTKLMFAFFKNGRPVQELGSKSIYRISSATPKDSGHYTCKVQLLIDETQNKTGKASTYVNVLELFSNPKIIVSPYPVAEGANITLTCRVDSLNGSALLQFAFLRNGQKLKEFSSSDKYQISETQLDHSGDYTCEVRTRDDKVKKMSQTLGINFQGNKDPEEETDNRYILHNDFLVIIISAAVPGILLIIGAALLFKYRHKCSVACIDQWPTTPPPVPDRDPSTREDMCYAQVDFAKVQKDSPSPADDNGVTYSILKTNTHLKPTISERPMKIL